MSGYFAPVRQWFLRFDPLGGKAVADALEAWIKPGSVALSDLADITSDRLLGRDTAGTGAVEELTVSGGLEFTGAGGIRTTAFTGDATKAAGGTVLTLATVNSNVGSFGTAANVASFTVNGKGLITAASNVPIAITASQVTDFSEAVDDRVAALLVAGSNITLTYNDAANTLTIAASSTPYMPVTLGNEPPTFLTDGAGRLIMVAFTA